MQQKDASSTQEDVFSAQRDVFSRSYTHDLGSLHPIQTILTPISTLAFTHTRRLRVSIPEPYPQYYQIDSAV